MSYSPPLNPQPVTGNQSTASTTAWTSATGINTANTITVTNMNTVSVTMSNTSTMTAGVLTFEVSPDGTTWFPIAMARIDSYTVETTYTLNTVANRAWTSSVDSFTNFRVRLSTVITGTGTATINVTAQVFAIEPISTVGQATAANLNGTMSLAAAQTLATVTTVGTLTTITNAVKIGGAATGGSTPYLLISAATTNSTLILTGARTLYSVNAYNNGATTAYVKIYNKATAPTIGTDTPIKVVMLPAGGGSNIVLPPQGDVISLGLGLGITGGPANTDTTAVALSQVIFNCTYS